MLSVLYPHHQGSYQDELTLTTTQVRGSYMYCTQLLTNIHYVHARLCVLLAVIEVTGNI